MNTHTAAITARIAQTEALQQLTEQRATEPGADLPALRITWKQHAHTLAALRNTDLTPPTDVQGAGYTNPEDPWTVQQPDQWLGNWD